MLVSIFNGSPRREGNTSALVQQLAAALTARGAEVEIVPLFQLNVLGCNNCGRCQHERLPRHCSIDDDMLQLYPKYLASDVCVLASPIYMWQFTPCTLAFINRLHCLAQSSDFRYNEQKGRLLAAAITMGDEKEVADYAVGGLKEFCEFYSMKYLGDVRVDHADRDQILASGSDREIGALADRIIARGQS